MKAKQFSTHVGWVAVLLGSSVSYGGLAFHVGSKTAVAKSTASSPVKTTYNQQCIADPFILNDPSKPSEFNDDTSYIVDFKGMMSWVGNVDFDSFSPDPKGVFTPGAPYGSEDPYLTIGEEPLSVRSAISPHASSTNSGYVEFTGYYAPFYADEQSHPTTLVNVDQDLITGNFDTIGNPQPGDPAPMVQYTVNLESILIYDTSTNSLYEIDNPNLPEGTFGAWDPATANTGDPDPNMPEPTGAVVSCLGASGLLMRRRKA